MVIIASYKGKDIAADCKNDRGLVCSMYLEDFDWKEMRGYTDKMQCGFMPGRGCAHQNFAP